MSQFIRTGIIAKFEDETVPIRREYDYYYKIMTDKEYFKETRILVVYSLFHERFYKNLKNLSKVELIAKRKTNLLDFFMSLLSAGGYSGILYMLVTALIAREITVGVFDSVFSSIGLMFSIMNEMINRKIGRITSNLGKAYNFIRFMEMPECERSDQTPPYNKGIVSENISFAYPDADSMSIDNVSIKIKAGETIAIVGENSAGKTTLVRLLMVYQVYSRSFSVIK